VPEPDKPGLRVGLFRELDVTLRAHGVLPCTVYRQVGLDVHRFEELPSFIEVDRAGALMEAAAWQTGNPDFGLQFAHHVPIGASGIFGQLQAAAPTVHDLMRITTDYVRLVISEMRPDWQEDESGGVLSAHMPVGTSSQDRQLTDMLMALLVLRVRLGAGQLWYPQLVTFETLRPADDKGYEGLFGANIVYAASSFSMFIEKPVLDRKLPFPVIGLLRTLKPLADQELREIDRQGGLPALVRAQIRQALSGSATITLEAIAGRLALSPRALQWRLARGGTSFETILNDMRRDIALAELASMGVSMSDISLRLGFSEPSAFSRWTTREFNASPTEVRRRLQHGK